MNKPKTYSLTLSQEVSYLISKIAEKELEFFVNDDIEVLHEFRVDIRKLRAWLQIFKSAGYRVKKLQNLLVRCHLIGNKLRNVDVLLHWMKKNPSLVSSKSIQTVHHMRKKLKKAFMKNLIQDDSISKVRILGRDFLSKIIEISKSDFQPVIEKYIEEKKQNISERLPYAADDLEQLREIRKLLKKMRYSLDLMPIIDTEKIDTFKELQDILGSINDRRVWIELLQSILKKLEEVSLLETIFRKDIKNKMDEFRTYCTSEKQRELFKAAFFD
jgi:CHAD domain-containing protein